jgi:hypothetical protein
VDQNLVLVNDVPLFNTAHALGFVSAFNQNVIEDFSLYKGNVPANFGGRAASLIDINTAEATLINGNSRAERDRSPPGLPQKGR